MRRDGEWATAFEITAASALLFRPIHLVTDHTEDADAVTRLEPPHGSSPAAWGPTIYLAHFLGVHFEATTPAPHPQQGHA